MDAQALFREGILALKEARDPVKARQLLSQSLKLDPNNEMAWLWLSRTTDDPARKMQCVERALAINPVNEQALALRAKLRGALATPVPTPPPTALESADGTPKTQRDALTPAEEKQIQAYLDAAEQCRANEDDEGALEQWLNALQIQIDHPLTLQRAVRRLYELKYIEDAKELLQRAIDADTPSLSIFLTTIDVYKALGDHTAVDTLREQIVLNPDTPDDAIIKITEKLLEEIQAARAVELLEKAIAARPKSAALLMRMGDMLDAQGRKTQSVSYYERAARLKGGKGRRAADSALSGFTPVITDVERGSIPLALREAVGVGAGFVLLAWQDAGLNLLRLSPRHLLGIGLSLVGGYLLVSATSSPQQRGVATFLGGSVPAEPEGKFKQAIEIKPWEEHVQLPPGPLQDPTQLPILPMWLRTLFGIFALVILSLAFYLVFNDSIKLLLNPVFPNYIPDIRELLSEE